MSDEDKIPALDTHYEPIRDMFLDLFVGMANDRDLSMSITIQLGGLMVSGMLVGLNVWENGVADQLTQAHQQFGEGFRQGMKLLRDREPTPAPDSPLQNPNYIHLRDARIYHPAGQTRDVLWWRGRLNEVDGWFLGAPSS